VSAVLQNVLPGMAAVKLTFSNITAEEAEKAKAKLEDSTWGSAKLFKVSDTEYAITASPYGLSLDVYHIDENTLYAAEYGKEVTTPKKLQEIGDRIEIDAAAHTLMDDLDIPNRDDVRSQRKFSNLYPHEQQAELDKIHSAAKLINTLKNNNRSR
jgi:thymidylate synthase